MFANIATKFNLFISVLKGVINARKNVAVNGRNTVYSCVYLAAYVAAFVFPNIRMEVIIVALVLGMMMLPVAARKQMQQYPEIMTKHMVMGYAWIFGITAIFHVAAIYIDFIMLTLIAISVFDVAARIMMAVIGRGMTFRKPMFE